jgi:hypothetical protein
MGVAITARSFAGSAQFLLVLAVIRPVPRAVDIASFKMSQ